MVDNSHFILSLVGECFVVIILWLVVFEVIKQIPISVTTQKITILPMDFGAALDVMLMSSDILKYRAELATSTNDEDDVVLYDVSDYHHKPNLSEVTNKRRIRMYVPNRFPKWIRNSYFDVVLYEQNGCQMQINIPGRLWLHLCAMSYLQVMDSVTKCTS